MIIGVVVKKGGGMPYKIAKEILEYGESLGINMVIDEEIAKDIGWKNTFTPGIDKIDFLIVVGGDGTLLRTIHRLESSDIPIIAVKAGRRNFLLDVDPLEVREKLKDLVEGKYVVEEYMRLRIKINTISRLPYAVNDVVIASARNIRSRVMSIEIRVDGELLYLFDGDGVIVATPLGSSAYTFSVGGPVVDADLNAIIVTPLAPLQPNAKSVVLSSNRIIEIKNVSENDAMVCIIDGETVAELFPGSSAEVFKADTGVKFVRFRKFKTYRRVQTCE